MGLLEVGLFVWAVWIPGSRFWIYFDFGIDLGFCKEELRDFDCSCVFDGVLVWSVDNCVCLEPTLLCLSLFDLFGVQGFIKSTSMILVSEIGDKTFFVAAVRIPTRMTVSVLFLVISRCCLYLSIDVLLLIALCSLWPCAILVVLSSLALMVLLR